MEISISNFESEFENIKNNLQKSCFIAYDGEFTGILSEECFKNRLFDSNEVRYHALKTVINKMIITQIGLSVFEYDKVKDTYFSTAYTFHLCPQNCGDIDQSFIFQASSLQFLKTHKFNFNKFIYDGIPYLSKEEEKSIREHLSKGTLIDNMLKDLEMSEFQVLQTQCTNVSNWLCSSKDDTLYIEVDSPNNRYLLHHEIRERFPNVLTTDSLGNSRKLLVYRNKDVEGATSASNEVLAENFLNSIRGFSRIITLLEKYQKPVVGHNLILDLLLLHNQFIGPLPNKYIKFKENIHQMFPVLLDTKYISHEMAKELKLETSTWKKNVLQDLYEFFCESKSQVFRRADDYIKLKMPFSKNQTYHEAGFDSYCTGYCFIRLSHLYVATNSGTYRVLTPTEMIAAVNQYLNKANVIRGSVPYMDLVGDDPPSHRPNFLVVYARNERVIDLTRMANLLTNYGAIDLKKHGSNSALIAVGSPSSAKKILSHFGDSPDYKVIVYKPYTRRLATWPESEVLPKMVIMAEPPKKTVNRVFGRTLTIKLSPLSSAFLIGSLGLYIYHKTK